MAETYNFVVVKYSQAETAQTALAVVKQLDKDKVVQMKDAVAITKSDKGKIKLHQTKDDSAGTGFLKGGLIGLILAVLLGPAGWAVAGALLGTAFAMFDRGIKNKVLKELGEKMTPQESALAVLVQQSDWETLKSQMAQHNFAGEVVISEVVDKHLEEVEKLTEKPEAVAAVPEELDVPASQE